MNLFRKISLTCIALIALGSLSTSNAATLPVSDVSLSTYSEQRCVERASVESVSTNSATTSVVITFTELDARCNGKTIALSLVGANGDVVSRTQRALPLTVDGPVTLTVPAFDPVSVTKASMTIASWGVPATWRFTATGSSCQVFDSRTSKPMPGASCSLGPIQFIWSTVDWPNMRIASTPVTKKLPANDDLYPASYYAYYVFSFTVRPSAPTWWNWSLAGFRDTRDNWCSAALTVLPDGIRVSGRTDSNIASADTWGLTFDIEQNRVTQARNACK